MATGFSYDSEVRERQARSLVRLLPQVRDVRRLGSCALDLCAVAEGTVDAYVEEGVHLWDHAAGALVARAAGARTELLPGASGRDLLVLRPCARLRGVPRPGPLRPATRQGNNQVVIRRSRGEYTSRCVPVGRHGAQSAADDTHEQTRRRGE